MKGFLLIALLVITTCHFHHHKRGGFRKKLHGLKNFNKEQFTQWQQKLLTEQKERPTIPHSYEEIANHVNSLKTTWTATTYKKTILHY